MLPWETLERARTPDGSELVLARRGQDYSIRIDNRELMTSRTHGSEEILAQAACAPIRRRQAPRVLIGGLGMGYTLRAALDTLGPEASVVVAELTPQVLEWNRTHLAELAGKPLDDPRARVELVDVGNLLDGKTKWDAVMLDVDNGPESLVREGNDRLYDLAGLARIHRSLTPGGMLAIWSAGNDPRFVNRMRTVGFKNSRSECARARGGKKGPRHFVFLGNT